ncbi:MAG TPA: recombinase, partial [Nitrosospira sp.]
MEPALYPYYYCFTKRCESYGKAIQREKIEGGFESLLHTLEPAAPLFKTAAKMFETRWNYRQMQIAQRGQAVEDEIRKLDGKIEQLMDRLVETDGDSMIKAYETRIKKLETDRAVLVEKSGQSLRPMRSFDAVLRTALDFIAKPHKLWSSGRLCDRHAVLKLAFPGGFQYHRNTGLRTAETPLPFKVLGA